MVNPAWQHLAKGKLAWQSGPPPRQSLEKCECVWQLLPTVHRKSVHVCEVRGWMGSVSLLQGKGGRGEATI